MFSCNHIIHILLFRVKAFFLQGKHAGASWKRQWSWSHHNASKPSPITHVILSTVCERHCAIWKEHHKRLCLFPLLFPSPSSLMILWINTGLLNWPRTGSKLIFFARHCSNRFKAASTLLTRSPAPYCFVRWCLRLCFVSLGIIIIIFKTNPGG